jgi:mono/diheme cytochrome c family protein
LRCSLAALAASFVLACGSDSEQAPAPTAAPGSGAAAQPAAPVQTPAATAGAGSDATRAEAEEIFATRCSTCHGASGAGDGPASAGLTPPPRNFQDPAWQASVTDEHIRQIIQYGGAAVGRSPAMPGNPDLTGKPEIVEALRAHLRGLGEG